MAKKILIVAPSWLGDIIMSQSLLKTLKAQDANSHIVMYAPKYAHSIIERMAEVDEILENPFAHGELNLKGRYSEGKKLKALGFDKAYVLPNSLKSALIPFFAGIKERIGLKGESRYILLNKMITNKKDYARMTARYVALAYIDDKAVHDDATLPKFDYPSLTTKAPDEALITRLGLSTERPLLALGCGANYGPAKLWPVEYFAKVSTHFIKQGGAVLGLGTGKDKETVDKIYAAMQQELDPKLHQYFYNIAGKTNLTEALDLVGMCKGAVCNDSGMMHTVAAVGVPQVCLFGSTSTLYTPPLSDKAICLESDESCHPCFKRTCQYGHYNCLKNLKVDDVIAALHKLAVL